MQAITILLYLSGNPKTRSEMMAKLKEIPPTSLYRKINKLEQLGLIRQITHHKRKNNVMYENTTKTFMIKNIGKLIYIIIS